MLGMWGCDGDRETPLCTTPWLSTIIPVPMHPAGLQSTAKPPPVLLLVTPNPCPHPNQSC